MVGAPGLATFGLISGRRLRIPFGAFCLLGGFGRRGALRFSGHLLFALVFPLKLLPQLTLDARVRRHDLAIRLGQRLRQFGLVNRPGGFSLPSRMAAFNEADPLIANSAFHFFLPPGRRQNTSRGDLSDADLFEDRRPRRRFRFQPLFGQLQTQDIHSQSIGQFLKQNFLTVAETDGVTVSEGFGC